MSDKLEKLIDELKCDGFSDCEIEYRKYIEACEESGSPGLSYHDFLLLKDGKPLRSDSVKA